METCRRLAVSGWRIIPALASLILIGLAAPIPAGAADAPAFYINNKPFTGAYQIRGDECYAELSPLAQRSGWILEWDPDRRLLTVGGTEIKGVAMGAGGPLAPVRQVAIRMEATCQWNPKTQIFDLYTFNPGETVKRQLAGILKYPDVSTDAEFLTVYNIVFLVCGSQLKMTLGAIPVTRDLVPLGEHGVTEEHPGYTDTLYYKQSGKARDCQVFILKGLDTPFAIYTTAHEFGHAWMSTHIGVVGTLQDREGFAEWVAHKVAAFCHLAHALEQRAQLYEMIGHNEYSDGYAFFKALEETGGSDAVFKYVQGLKPNAE